MNLLFALLCAPSFFAPEIPSREVESHPFDMTWNYQNDLFHFITNKDTVYFELIFSHIPESYEESIKNRFIKVPEGYLFAYEEKKGEPFKINIRKQNERVSEEVPYLVEPIRIIENSHPQTLDEKQLLSILQNHSVLFYTGAGLSIAAGIPSMDQLHQLLGIESTFHSSFKKAVENPKLYSQNIYAFYEACISSQPTAAHYAIKRLCQLKKCPLYTENLDVLHEKSGIEPIRINPLEITEQDFSHIDYIICVGLSHDDRGFLGWYKKQNPQGKIIAVDLGNPNYLGDEDYLIQADLQRLLPDLADYLKSLIISI